MDAVPADDVRPQTTPRLREAKRTQTHPSSLKVLTKLNIFRTEHAAYSFTTRIFKSEEELKSTRLVRLTSSTFAAAVETAHRQNRPPPITQRSTGKNKSEIPKIQNKPMQLSFTDSAHLDNIIPLPRVNVTSACVFPSRYLRADEPTTVTKKKHEHHQRT